MTPNFPNRGPSWLLAAWAFLLGGCASMGTLQTADTLGQGKSRWSLQLMVQAIGRDEPNTLPEPTPPQLAVAWQHGVTDSLDVGARVYNLGGELSAKVRLVHLEQPRLTLSLAPTLGAESWTGDAHFTAALPLLLGVRTETGSQLVLGLRPLWTYPTARTFLGAPSSYPSVPLHTLALGGTVGYVFRLGERVRLMPELALLMPLGAYIPPSGNVPPPEGQPTPGDYWRRTGVVRPGDLPPFLGKPHVQLGLALMLD